MTGNDSAPGPDGVMTGFDVAVFLSDYWQKKPLLIRGAWPSWRNPIAPDELAGLACEDGVEARLIIAKGRDWRVEHGPFAAKRFAKLPPREWTLLVQAVDHAVPEVAALIEPFRFVPNWRIDDVMVSYATNDGGVGPHFDHYDVFLVQGLGQRRWRVGGMCDATTPLRPHDTLRLLVDFEAVGDWVLGPGDMLYVPPGVAHDGIAVGDDCMTYSIGFRAPLRSELIAHWAEGVLDRLTADDRLTDTLDHPQLNPGEIAADAVDRARSMVMESLSDEAAFADWFGRFSTAPKYPENIAEPDVTVTSADVHATLAEERPLIRNAASRFSFVRLAGGAIAPFVDGERIDCPAEANAFAEAICASARLVVTPAAAQSEAVIAMITDLINRGSVAFADAA